jgi:hypothetical protein
MYLFAIKKEKNATFDLSLKQNHELNIDAVSMQDLRQNYEQK